MKTRIISGVVMLPLLAVLYFGGWAVKIAGFSREYSSWIRDTP